MDSLYYLFSSFGGCLIFFSFFQECLKDAVLTNFNVVPMENASLKDGSVTIIKIVIMGRMNTTIAVSIFKCTYLQTSLIIIIVKMVCLKTIQNGMGDWFLFQRGGWFCGYIYGEQQFTYKALVWLFSFLAGKLLLDLVILWLDSNLIKRWMHIPLILICCERL